MSVTAAIVFCGVVFLAWQSSKEPVTEVTKEQIAKQEALIAKLKDRALGKHPEAYIHEAIGKEEAVLTRMYVQNVKFYKQEKAKEDSV